MTTGVPLQAERVEGLREWMRITLLIGVVLLAVSLVGAFFTPQDFFRSYLMSYLFYIGLTLGSMAVVMLQYLTGGQWGILIRRPLECAAQTLPLLFVLFIPIAIGIPYLYNWDHPQLVLHDDVLRHRAVYMNAPMFLLRAVIYFAIWAVLIYFLSRWSTEQDQQGGLTRKLERLSAPGLILYVFTVTFAAVDWAESVEPHWQSTMWGFLFVAGQGLSAIAFAIVMLTWLKSRSPLGRLLKPSHFQDLGKLLLMWVMIWAYFSFSQLLIVWAGNLTSEIPWYLKRLATSWGWLGVALILFQFLVPFALLLSRKLKRNAALLAGVVGILVVMRFVDLIWIVMPSFYSRGIHLSWLTLSLPLALGGLWIAFFLWRLSLRPVFPVHALGIEEILHGEE